MIRRDADNHWLLISQLEHARIAAELAEAWNDPELVDFPRRSELLSAIRHHDDGWAGWELAPTINEAGEPRDFTEMPMPVATAIWTRSIETCTSRPDGDAVSARMLKEFDAWLRARGLRLTQEREYVVAALAESSDATAFEGVAEALIRKGQRVSRATLYRTMAQLEKAGIVERVDSGESEWLWRARIGTRTRSPYAGLWVSRHFCYLAEHALETRDTAADIDAINGFLFRQALMQDQRRKELDDANGDVSFYEERGYLWLQTFDRISLWLCCAERTESWNVVLPSGSEATFLPLQSGEITIDPFPFDGPVTLTVEATRLTRQTFQDDEHLTLGQFPRQRMEWSLIPKPE